MARPNTLYYHSSIWQLDYRLGMSVKIYGKRTQVLHNEHSSYYRQHTHNNTEKRKKKKGNYIYYINVKKGRKIQVTVKTAVTHIPGLATGAGIYRKRSSKDRNNFQVTSTCLRDKQKGFSCRLSKRRQCSPSAAQHRTRPEPSRGHPHRRRRRTCHRWTQQ